MALLNSAANAQVSIERIVDTLSTVQLQPLEGDTIYFLFRDSHEPILFGKDQLTSEVKIVMNEMETRDSFSRSDSMKHPFSEYLDFERCLNYLDTADNLLFETEVPVLAIHMQSTRNFAKIYIGQFSCLLFEKGLFNFKKESRFFGKSVYKAKVTETTKYYTTESTKFLIDSVLFGKCPPIIHADFVGE